MDTKTSKRSGGLRKVIIVGAGAAGLMAANCLKDRNCEVLLLEKKHQCGLKLRITGKGRCNLTNASDKNSFLASVSDKEFFEPSFDAFDNTSLMDFFTFKGVELKTERGQRVYPTSNKAADIFFALLEGIENDNRVKIIKNCDVRHVITQDSKAKGVVTNQGNFFADAVILATGGRSYPTTGSEGDGYRIAELLGHHIITPVPALVGLRTKNGYPLSAHGTEIKNCRVNITDSHRKVIASKDGDIMLDEYGVSGPVILTLSRQIARRLDGGEKLFLNIDYKPKVDKDKLYGEIKETFRQRRTEQAASIIRKWFVKPLTQDVLEVCRIQSRTMGYKLTQQNAESLLWYMKDRKEEIVGDMGWREAVVTMGGVSLEEVDKYTMESRKIKNLYITGELLDLDADTGGFNLQIAFSTAMTAARSIR
ncbi:MAG: aminoacetone oxidase family FAD-binding enzyme [Bacteroidales bacterium]|nr:aminoacetone oxidase family FAD-binding enzyme [Bacteroidales bacterium]